MEKNLEDDQEFNTFMRIRMKVANQLLIYMKENKIKKKEMAERLGILKKDVKSILKEKAIITIELLVRISGAMNKKLEINFLELHDEWLFKVEREHLKEVRDILDPPTKKEIEKSVDEGFAEFSKELSKHPENNLKQFG